MAESPKRAIEIPAKINLLKHLRAYLNHNFELAAINVDCEGDCEDEVPRPNQPHLIFKKDNTHDPRGEPPGLEQPPRIPPVPPTTGQVPPTTGGVPPTTGDVPPTTGGRHIPPPPWPSAIWLDPCPDEEGLSSIFTWPTSELMRRRGQVADLGTEGEPECYIIKFVWGRYVMVPIHVQRFWPTCDECMGGDVCPTDAECTAKCPPIVTMDGEGMAVVATGFATAGLNSGGANPDHWDLNVRPNPCEWAHASGRFRIKCYDAADDPDNADDEKGYWKIDSTSEPIGVSTGRVNTTDCPPLGAYSGFPGDPGGVATLILNP